MPAIVLLEPVPLDDAFSVNNWQTIFVSIFSRLLIFGVAFVNSVNNSLYVCLDLLNKKKLSSQSAIERRKKNFNDNFHTLKLIELGLMNLFLIWILNQYLKNQHQKILNRCWNDGKKFQVYWNKFEYLKARIMKKKWWIAIAIKMISWTCLGIHFECQNKCKT